IDMALSNKLIFEIKGSQKELEQVAEDARRKYLGSEIARDAEYFIATNYDWWKIYRVKRAGAEPQLELLYDGRKDGAIDELKQIIAQLPQLRIYPLPQNVVLLYKQNAEEIEKKLMSVFKDAKEDWRVKPLYNAYKTVMKMLYGEESEQFFEDLFIKHTYLHMVVLASLTKALGKTGCPTDVASGVLLDVNVALPYLNWWKVFSDDERVRSVIDEIVLRASLIDWEAGLTEDVFRALYEELIEPNTRRKIGEYYTPIWLVDFALRDFDLRGKTVLDPFCGSGTFLVRAFHRKVDAEEDVDRAFSSLVGYDVNPLAVTVARAELIMAYKRRAGREPSSPPRVYHIDTLALWFGGEQALPDDVRALVKSGSDFARTLQLLLNMKVVEVRDVLEEMSSVEQLITGALRHAYTECLVR
ncbi:MAG: N-6 DNA methylase, partial [Candidatus Methanomethylicaceae archaeon]